MYVYTHICIYIAISLCFSCLGRIWVTLLHLAGFARTSWFAGLTWHWPGWVAGLHAVGLATADLQMCPKEGMQHVPPGHFYKPASAIAKLRWAPFLCVSTATPCASLHHFINILYWDNLSTLPSPVWNWASWEPRVCLHCFPSTYQFQAQVSIQSLSRDSALNEITLHSCEGYTIRMYVWKFFVHYKETYKYKLSPCS